MMFLVVYKKPQYFLLSATYVSFVSCVQDYNSYI